MSSDRDAKRKTDQHLCQERKSVAMVTRRPTAAAAVFPGSAAPCWTIDAAGSSSSITAGAFDRRLMVINDGNDQPGGREKRDEKKEERQGG